jgi:hypothetical protein
MKILDKIELCKNYFYVTISDVHSDALGVYICAWHPIKRYIYLCPDKQWHTMGANTNHYFSTLTKAKQCLKKCHPEAIVLDRETWFHNLKNIKDASNLDFNTHCCNEKTVE